jgi:tetratricopeptide (TPR) repeat protein
MAAPCPAEGAPTAANNLLSTPEAALYTPPPIVARISMNRLVKSIALQFCFICLLSARLCAASADPNASLCMNETDPDKRIAACSKVLTAQPKPDAGLAWAMAARGVAYFTKGDLDHAMKDFDGAIKLDPKNDTALANRGTARMAQGQSGPALLDYTAALKLNPKNANTYNLRGLLYFRTGHPDQAIADYTNAIKYNPKFTDAYNDRGYAYYSAQKFDPAVTDFSMAMKLAPKDPLPVYMRSLAYRKMGKNAQADQDLAAARKLDPQIEEQMKGLGVS